MELSRSFRQQQGSSSFKLCRSESSLLMSESISNEYARLASYERLSGSMRLGNECVLGKSRCKKNKAWGILSKVLSFRKHSGDMETKQLPEFDEENKKTKKKKNLKKHCKWLPDPEKRWPVQGW